MLIGLPSELGITVDLEKEHFLTVDTNSGKYKFSYKTVDNYVYCYIETDSRESMKMYTAHKGSDGIYKVFSFSKVTLQKLRKHLMESRSLTIQRKWLCTLKNLKKLEIG